MPRTANEPETTGNVTGDTGTGTGAGTGDPGAGTAGTSARVVKRGKKTPREVNLETRVSELEDENDGLRDLVEDLQRTVQGFFKPAPAKSRQGGEAWDWEKFADDPL